MKSILSKLWYVWVIAAVAFIIAMEANGAHPFTFSWLK